MKIGSWVDPRFGLGWPRCDFNNGRRSVRLDFGNGDVFVVQYQSGGIAPLLAAVAQIKGKNTDGTVTPYRVTQAETYACRSMRTENKASLHSWPVAIDINPSHNSMGGGRGDIPQWFADIMEAHGFTWGLAWNDAMHFENPAWYGMWDGNYPEVDDVALTDAEKQALAFIGANEANFVQMFDFMDGVVASMKKQGVAPKDTASAKAGFRFSNELDLPDSGKH